MRARFVPAPAAVNKSNVKKYGKTTAITAYKEFPGRSHYILGQDGWEEVAENSLTWAVEHASIPATAARSAAADGPIAAVG